MVPGSLPLYLPNELGRKLAPDLPTSFGNCGTFALVPGDFLAITFGISTSREGRDEPPLIADSGYGVASIAVALPPSLLAAGVVENVNVAELHQLSMPAKWLLCRIT